MTLTVAASEASAVSVVVRRRLSRDRRPQSRAQNVRMRARRRARCRRWEKRRAAARRLTPLLDKRLRSGGDRRLFFDRPKLCTLIVADRAAAKRTNSWWRLSIECATTTTRLRRCRRRRRHCRLQAADRRNASLCLSKKSALASLLSSRRPTSDRYEYGRRQARVAQRASALRRRR